MRNCITFVLYAKWRLKGKIVVHSYSGAWRSREWPVIPHLALHLKDGTLVHWKAHSRNLPLWKMFDFDGDVVFEKRKKITEKKMNRSRSEEFVKKLEVGDAIYLINPEHKFRYLEGPMAVDTGIKLFKVIQVIDLGKPMKSLFFSREGGLRHVLSPGGSNRTLTINLSEDMWYNNIFATEKEATEEVIRACELKISNFKFQLDENEKIVSFLKGKIGPPVSRLFNSDYEGKPRVFGHPTSISTQINQSKRVKEICDRAKKTIEEGRSLVERAEKQIEDEEFASDRVINEKIKSLKAEFKELINSRKVKFEARMAELASANGSALKRGDENVKHLSREVKALKEEVKSMKRFSLTQHNAMIKLHHAVTELKDNNDKLG